MRDANAIRFTPRGGRVRITLERVNSHLEVSFAGIAPEFLPRVFERFRQADATTTRRHAGLALGLAIVKHLAGLHGGGVRVQSPGLSQGSPFTVSLPLAPLHTDPEEDAASRRHPAESPPTGERAHTPAVSGVRVLLVDDGTDARATIARLLAKGGAEVRMAVSGGEALTLLDDYRPEVLISDISMPHMDGFTPSAPSVSVPRGGAALPPPSPSPPTPARRTASNPSPPASRCTWPNPPTASNSPPSWKASPDPGGTPRPDPRENRIRLIRPIRRTPA